MSDTQEWTPNVQQVGGNQNEAMNYVRSLLREGRTDEARAELQMMIEADPQDTRAMMAFAMSLVREQRLEEAAPYVERALEVEPGDRKSVV